MTLRTDFLPVNRQDMLACGWDACDFVLVTADAYVDHPSFAMAVIGRVLQAAGYRVGILAQPDWHRTESFLALGVPRLAWLISGGNMDSMVNHYTVAKRRRAQDLYSPGGKMGLRPDRATLVYANACRRAAPGVPVVIGGMEASLRRFAHYDYWDDAVRGSFLVASGADYLSFGMGERSLKELAYGLDQGWPQKRLNNIRGLCVHVPRQEVPANAVWLPSAEECAADKTAFARAFALAAAQQDPIAGRPVAQMHGGRALLQNPPAMPLTTAELDAVHQLPYVRAAHPDYDSAGGVPALEEVQFSVTAVRGCYGNCSFCSLTFHQGRQITCRSADSVVQEITTLTKLPGFKGYIHDLGGPSANFCAPSCDKCATKGACPQRNCIGYKPCKNLRVSHQPMLQLLRRARQVPGVKKVFVRSGIRYDYLVYEKDSRVLRELAEHHISGQLKVAPEHVCDRVLQLMNKPSHAVYDRFMQQYQAACKQIGKEQYLVPYLMSSHPGSDLNAAIELAEYLKKHRIKPEQVQDFYPTPGTRSTCMYYTGLDPDTLQPVYVPKTPQEKAMQRALLQVTRPQNYHLVRQALVQAGREDLIGFGPNCLIPPYVKRSTADKPQTGKPAAGTGQAKRPGGPHAGRRPAGKPTPHKPNGPKNTPQGKPNTLSSGKSARPQAGTQQARRQNAHRQPTRAGKPHKGR